MISAFAAVMSRFVERWLPSPLLFAIVLGFVMFVWGMCLGNTPLEMVNIWGGGFWNLLAFTMQMAMIIISGCALASSGPCRKLLSTIASVPKTNSSAVFTVTLCATIGCALNWGFGLVVGAILAREVARQNPKYDYGLLIAAGYIGFLVWGAGFSGSMPLLAATANNPMASKIAGLFGDALPGGVIPIQYTLLTTYNIFLVVAMIVVLPIVTSRMLPKTPRGIDPSLLENDQTTFNIDVPKDAVPAVKLEESKIVTALVSLIGLAYLCNYFYEKGFNININIMNYIFVVLGMILHKTPMAYMRAVEAATKNTAGVVMQFPFYAAIAAMMEKSGVGSQITEWFVAISTPDTFPVFTWICSGIINFVVPSGGGHWVVQGPFAIDAAAEIIKANNLPVAEYMGRMTMGIAYGDMWTNMAQPFWALPALAIAGLGVRDIMGYCITAMLFAAPIFFIALYFL